MKHTIASSVLLSLAALGGVLASSSLGASRAGAVPTLQPEIVGLAPGLHGTGRGTWSGPDLGLGRLRATSSLSPKGPYFAFDASLARIVPMGPHGPGIEGTLWGEVLEIDPDGGSGVVAFLLGQWFQDEDGRGAYVAHIIVPTKDPREPLLAVGRATGMFRTPPPDSGRAQDGVATIRWSVTN